MPHPRVTGTPSYRSLRIRLTVWESADGRPITPPASSILSRAAENNQRLLKPWSQKGSLDLVLRHESHEAKVAFSTLAMGSMVGFTTIFLGFCDFYIHFEGAEKLLQPDVFVGTYAGQQGGRFSVEMAFAVLKISKSYNYSVHVLYIYHISYIIYHISYIIYHISYIIYYISLSYIIYHILYIICYILYIIYQ